MATSKKNTFIEADLEWGEAKLQEWRDYVDANPFASLQDRVSYKETKTGGVIPMVVATIEQQQTSLRNTLKDYFTLLDVVKKLREVEEQKKIAARGDQQISPLESGDI